VYARFGAGTISKVAAGDELKLAIDFVDAGANVLLAKLVQPGVTTSPPHATRRAEQPRHADR
jgi:hypothetical protein